MNKSGNQVECPQCGNEFSITDAVAAEMDAKLRKEWQEKEVKLRNNYEKKEHELFDKESKLKALKENFDNHLQTQLSKEKQIFEQELKRKWSEQAQSETEQIKKELEIWKQKNQESNQKELQLLKKVEQAEEKEKNLNLEIEREVHRRSSEIKKGAAFEFDQRIKLFEKETQLKEESLKRKVEDLTRKLEQGSQQIQGEVAELILEDELKQSFAIDDFQPVAKGIRGGDLIQVVKNARGQGVGKILWESKKTKAWSDGWVSKLKDDQRELKADCAVIVSQVLPKDVSGFVMIDGIWVCGFELFSDLCAALRIQLIQLNSLRSANVGKSEKMESLYQYLSGNEFGQRVLSIVEAFQSMKLDLEKEKTSMKKHWAKREKELDRVITGTAGMYGDLEGIIGGALPRVSGLEMDDAPPLLK